MPKVRVRTSLAVKVAGISRIAFNEAVSDGYFNCAPKTRKGSARVFEEYELIGLCIFGLLLENMPAREAGLLACEAQEIARCGRDETRIVLIKSTLRDDRMFPGSEVDQCNPERLSETLSHHGMGLERARYEFNLDTIRMIIAQAIEDELSIVGQDDGSD